MGESATVPWAHVRCVVALWFARCTALHCTALSLPDWLFGARLGCRLRRAVLADKACQHVVIMGTRDMPAVMPT